MTSTDTRVGSVGSVASAGSAATHPDQSAPSAVTPYDDQRRDQLHSGPLLQVSNLETHFTTDRGILKAVDDISFELDYGQTIGIVGESGSGKSVTVRSIMNILPRNVGYQAGDVIFEGRDIQHLSRDAAKHFWGVEMAMIFQDPLTSSIQW